MNLTCISLARKRSYPPRVSAFTQPFWSALSRGEWQTTKCDACGKFTFPPKPVCPHCWSDAMGWAPLSSQGVLYSWSRVHAPPEVFIPEAPYAVCIVDLDVGLRIASRAVEREGVPFVPGMTMEMVALQYEDGPLFAARPA